MGRTTRAPHNAASPSAASQPAGATVTALPKRPRRAHDAVDRAQVLAAAAKLFRAQGYDKTSLKEIAAACGMLPGSLHYRYPSKDDLLVDMMRLGINHVLGAAVDAARGVTDPVEQMRRVLIAHLNTLVRDSDTVYVLLFEWRSLKGPARDELVALRDAYEGQWMILLKGLRRQGLVRQDVDLTLLRLVALGAMNWVSTWYHDGGRYTLEDIGNFIWQIARDAVLTPEARARYIHA